VVVGIIAGANARHKML